MVLVDVVDTFYLLRDIIMQFLQLPLFLYSAAWVASLSLAVDTL